MGSSVTTAELEARITRLFTERLHLELPIDHVDLIGTGLVDSLLLVELLALLEQEFGIQIGVEDLDLDHFRSIPQLAAFVAARVSAPGRARG